ncbi:MAG: hypothetical protein M3Z05_00820 [Gemmatimonadota bacterium]|nr:hypothetical protein [Gemmatimonadota bacterium]
MRTENIGLMLTLGYLFLTALGMFHRALVFLMFRINVFDYAEPSDFLLAALRDPLIVLVCVAPIPLLSIYYRLARGLQTRTKSKWLRGSEKHQALTAKYRRPIFAFTAGLWALAASLHYASSVATDLRAGDGRKVQVELIAGAAQAPIDTTPQLLLGTTQKFVFLYDAPSQVTSVIPIGNIARIRVDRRKSPAPRIVAPPRQ